MDGFSTFIGVMLSAAAALVIGMIVGYSVASVKEDAVSKGWMEHRGAYYSVKPTKLLAQP